MVQMKNAPIALNNKISSKSNTRALNTFCQRSKLNAKENISQIKNAKTVFLSLNSATKLTTIALIINHSLRVCAINVYHLLWS